MQVTPALKKELAQWLDTYWTTYLKGDIETWATFIRDDYRNIGGTKEEIWNSKQEIIDYTRRILDQMLGTAEIRNREIEVIPYGEYMMVNEFTDLFVKIEGEWTFYAPFRMSSLLEKTDTGWIALHQHGSYPDMKALQGEAFSIDVLKAENVKLQEAVKSRTIELEIEASLERVRAVAMGMKKPEDMLDVCRIISDQLQQFGIAKIRNVQTAIIDESIGQYLCYQYFPAYDQTTIEDTDYHKSPVEQEMVREMLASRDGHFIGSLEGEALEVFRSHRKEENHFPDPLLDQASELSYAFLSIGEGGLGLSLYQAMGDGILTLFKRFHQVFSLAYQRFRDIQKAEAQTREAQIEAALERVRSKALAMHNSHDISETSSAAFEELKKLGIHSIRSGVGLLTEGSHDAQVYASALAVDGRINALTTKRSMLDHPALILQYEQWKKQVDFEQEMSGDELMSYYDHQFYKSAKEAMHKANPGIKEYGCYFSFKDGLFYSWSDHRYSDAEKNILQRFRSIIALTFRRYLDLQNAEEQARESQIQLAMERVRARTMAMQHSSELSATAALLFQQIKSLGVPPWSCGFNIWEQGDTVFTSYMGSPEGVILPGYKIPLTEEATFIHFQESRDRGEELYIDVLQGETIEIHYKYFQTLPGIREIFEKRAEAGFPLPTYQINHLANFSHGNLMFITYEPCPEAHEIFKRFAKVFEQTYTRFLDLQKAEAQARESQIQLALERVRARTMAMQKSEELGDAATVLFKQLRELGGNLWSAGFVLLDAKSEVCEFRMSNPEGEILLPVSIPNTTDPATKNMYNYWKKGAEYYTEEAGGNDLKKHYDYLLSLPEAKPAFQALLDAGIAFPTWQKWHAVYFSGGYLLVITLEPFENTDMLKRFAKVFDQTYTRFLDIQKAEAQSREAQIQLALERVRAKTMAMQNSEELAEVSYELNKQVVELGIPTRGCAFNIYNEHDSTEWFSNLEGTIPVYKTPRENIFLKYYEAGQRGETLWIEEFDGERIKAHYKYLSTLNVVGKKDDTIKESVQIIPEHQIDHVAYFKYGYLLFITLVPAPQAHEVFKRFAKEFEQTYARFLDLKKAESQAREAQIEVALERVRSRTMAMQHSEELLEVASIVFQQVKALGVPQWDCGVNIWNKGDTEFTYYPGNNDGKIFPSPCKIPLMEHPVFRRFHESRMRGDDLFIYEKQGKEQTEHFEYMLSLPVLGDLLRSMVDAGLQFPTFQIDHLANFAYGNLIFITFEHCPEMHDVFRRFAKVFEQTYTRFLDLQKAETQALEAIKRASVDRVRAEIASMRTTGDLDRITPLIWNELTTLSVPFIRCGVFIMDEDQQQVHTYLSNPEGDAIAAFHQPYKAPGEIAEVVKSWRKKEMYTQHWDEARFVAFTTDLVQQGAITSGEKYLTENRPTDLYLHFLPFLQGMLYVGNTEALSDDALQLVQNLADAFSTAYARYEDFNKLEAAKQQVDKTLTDLKQAQSQLVQAEKMASLGELTAGIAHEIQNPLNFVNNFSELSNELIEEMQEEMDKGNNEEAKQIATDIRSNLEKINLHGKRADAIVKGMLQHSRATSGEKQPTDINALADEFLRLAYHGLRAKDKSFNATLKTAFDPTIGKVAVISQDIGRVLLNLINNAFYAVTEKNKMGNEGYEPQVVMRTRKLSDKIEISVSDNGNGIPQKVIDKIFQPFFTTKPTGQGTGLGLSLSYDIVKAHGGELRVVTKEGEGCEFVIQIPIV